MKNVDPENTAETEYRIFRGGSWTDDAPHCRVAVLHWSTTDSHYNFDKGLRVVVVSGSGVGYWRGRAVRLNSITSVCNGRLRRR
ncbi:MAG: hypothetical protein ISS69_06060 [Phycisphaerae bacterium]|nr:hypothetical protein [Phycisphaerae bacterium]